jgi:nucleoid-associated protein YgaU
MALALGAGTAGAEPAGADVRNPSVTDPTMDPSLTPTPTAPTMEPTQIDPTLNPELDPATSGNEAATGTESFGSSDQEHVVQKGDTLAELAERYLGAADEWRRIAEANDIDDPTKLAVGTRLSIPKDDGDS